MNSLLLLATLLTATFQYDITYQIVTNDIVDHTAYSFHGTKIVDTPRYNVYALNISACELRESMAEIIDEALLFARSKKVRKSFFSLEIDYIDNRCLLIVENHPYRRNTDYTYEYDYWIPDYNAITIHSSKHLKYPFYHRYQSIRKHRSRKKLHKPKKVHVHYSKPKLKKTSTFKKKKKKAKKRKRRR